MGVWTLKRIGFDVDGVLADFCPTYQQLFVDLTGRDTFQPGDSTHPPSWNWPTDRGYTDEETSAVWAAIKARSDFWLNLPALPGLSTLQRNFADLDRDGEVYFITSRVGDDVKWQSECWLQTHLCASRTPTVLISSEKGLSCAALKLDAYIDDNFDNIQSVLRDSPKTRAYLLDRPYNRLARGVLPRRVFSVEEMLILEGFTR